MSTVEKSFPVSWDQFPRDARALAWRLAGTGQEWKAIVCITRGGLVPAAIIARELGTRLIETVCVASYHDYTTQGEIEVLKEVDPKLMANDGEGILIIDDQVDRLFWKDWPTLASMPKSAQPRSTWQSRGSVDNAILSLQR